MAMRFAVCCSLRDVRLKVTARRALSSRLDIGDRFFHQLAHDAADLMVGLDHALGGEILADLAITSWPPASSMSLITTDLA